MWKFLEKITQEINNILNLLDKNQLQYSNSIKQNGEYMQLNSFKTILAKGFNDNKKLAKNKRNQEFKSEIIPAAEEVPTEAQKSQSL